MQYVIDDTPIIEADVLVKQPPLISSEVLVPIKTISHEEIPDVSPLQIVDYGSSSIECAFDVTTQEAEEVVRGVLCGTTNPPTFENADYRLLHGQGSMDLAFAGLHVNTEYYLRPYALSNLGYKYGDVVAQRTKASPIPDEYQLVEYLRSSGTQYIRTSYKFSGSALRIRTRCRHFTSLGTWSHVCFVQDSSSNRLGNISFLGTYNYSTGGLLTANEGINWGTAENGVYYDYDVTWDLVQNVISGYRDVTYRTLSTPLLDVNLYYYIFAKNNDNSAIELLRGDICYISFSDGDSVQCSLYPVYRKSDSKPGMYDIVNNVFYINQGTGEFIVGPDKEWEE